MTDTDALSFERRLSAQEERSSTLATKEDLAILATKEDLAILRADLLAMKADLIKWFIGAQIALAALIIYLLQ